MLYLLRPGFGFRIQDARSTFDASSKCSVSCEAGAELMNHILCVLKDVKGGYAPPIAFYGIPHAVRESELRYLKSKDTMLGQYPGDFELWCIGEWDSQTGDVKVYQDKEFLFSFADFAKKVQVENDRKE